MALDLKRTGSHGSNGSDNDSLGKLEVGATANEDNPSMDLDFINKDIEEE